MGTNYYMHIRKEKIHIGKSSAGWVFALHVYPERSINDLADWIPLWHAGAIYDEYDRIVTPEEMIKIIACREWNGVINGLHSNEFEMGPNGLLQTVGKESNFVKHGAGTWDCYTGDFS